MASNISDQENSLVSLEKLDRNSPDLWPDQNQENSLVSLEKLDRNSPDLWPDQIPGVSDFVSYQIPSVSNTPQPSWLQELDQDDLNLLHQFGSLTSACLVEEVRKLQNILYQLGLDEAKEMTRGKILRILKKQ